MAHVRGTDRFTLDLALSTTPLPAPAAYRPQYAAGLLAHLDAVVDEYLEGRGVRPLRLVLTGPPMAGEGGGVPGGQLRVGEGGGSRRAIEGKGLGGCLEGR